MPFLLGLLLKALSLDSASAQTGLFLVSSSGLLIVVGVVRDTFMNIDAELKLHGYRTSLLVAKGVVHGDLHRLARSSRCR